METPGKVVDEFKFTGMSRFKVSVLTNKSWYIFEWNPVLL